MPCRHTSEGAHKRRPSDMPRMQLRQIQSETLAPKGKEQSKKIKPVTIPGQVVSVDQLVSYTPGLIPTNNKTRPRTKHLSVRLHHFRSQIVRKKVSIEHVSTTEMLADIPTKPLPTPQFKKLRDLIMGWTTS